MVQSLPLSLRNIGAAGIIVIMLTVMLVFGGLGFLFLSSLSIDQQRFFEAFNQSVVENRERAEEESKFRDIQLQEINESQERTRQFLPPLLQSINDTAFVAKVLPDLIKNTDNITDVVSLLNHHLARANFQYMQANNTAANVTEILIILEDLE